MIPATAFTSDYVQIFIYIIIQKVNPESHQDNVNLNILQAEIDVSEEQAQQSQNAMLLRLSTRERGNLTLGYNVVFLKKIKENNGLVEDDLINFL